MPFIMKTIPEVTTHIADIASQEIVNQILEEINAKAHFDGKIHMRTDHRVSSEISDTSHRANLQNDYCDVEVDPTFNPADTKWTTMTFWNVFNQPMTKGDIEEEHPIFKDPDADIFLSDKRTPFSVSLTFNLFVRDRELAFTYFNTILSVFGNEATFDHRTITYDYPINNFVFYALHTLYKLRTELNTKMTFKEYIKKYSADIIGTSTSIRTGHKEVVIRAGQADVMGQLEISAARPVPVMDNMAAVGYTVTFTYAYMFMRPDTHFLYFPVTVDNKLVPAVLLDINYASEWALRASTAKIGLGAYVTAGNINMPGLTKKFPFYDEWNTPPNHPLGVMRKYFTIASMNFTLDENEDHVTSFNLIDAFTSLGYPLRDDVIQFLKWQSTIDTLYGGGLFRIAVFSNDSEIEPSRVSLDKDINISIKAVNKTKRYHLVFCIAIHGSVLSDAVLNKLKSWTGLFDLDHWKGDPSRGYHTPLRHIAYRIFVAPDKPTNSDRSGCDPIPNSSNE